MEQKPIHRRHDLRRGESILLHLFSLAELRHEVAWAERLTAPLWITMDVGEQRSEDACIEIGTFRPPWLDMIERDPLDEFALAQITF